ncbi:uncharacterized protein LY89DRAFT_781067 [Mollisia scopiformis]|uniref:C2H2-type domain-containing protein n=1 Tax=Mollisia scopiformis TaxID=149040 RepID=A0A194XCR6_MOLSC|nr:uncharacterized protein LY89DRAFT_781067 [Mollisia scopiformis]KUJ17946.1 hypothetical protein LY89DRAFT_781067 [Mollisia scopiformis]
MVLVKGILAWVLITLVEAIQYGSNSVDPTFALQPNRSSRSITTTIFHQSLPIIQATTTTADLPTPTFLPDLPSSLSNETASTNDTGDEESTQLLQALIEVHDNQRAREDELILHQKRLWAPDWDEPVTTDSTWWPLLGTVALAAITIQLPDENEDRIKRQRTWTPDDDYISILEDLGAASSSWHQTLNDMDIPLDDTQSVREPLNSATFMYTDETYFDPDKCLSGLTQQRSLHHPSVVTYLSALRNRDLLQEKLNDMLSENTYSKIHSRVLLGVPCTGEEEMESVDEVRLQIERIDEKIEEIAFECTINGINLDGLDDSDGWDEDVESIDIDIQERNVLAEEPAPSVQTSAYTSFSDLLPRKTGTEPVFTYHDLTASDDSIRTSDRINQWLLESLRTSSLEVRRLVDIFESTTLINLDHKLYISKPWQRRVLHHWYNDESDTSFPKFASGSLDHRVEESESIIGDITYSTNSSSLRDEDFAVSNDGINAPSAIAASLPEASSLRRVEGLSRWVNWENTLSSSMTESDEVVDICLQNGEDSDSSSIGGDLDCSNNGNPKGSMEVDNTSFRMEAAIGTPDGLALHAGMMASTNDPLMGEEQYLVDVDDPYWIWSSDEFHLNEFEPFCQDSPSPVHSPSAQEGAAFLDSVLRSPSLTNSDPTSIASIPSPTVAPREVNGYSCEHCSQKYSRPGDLRKHTKYHDKEIRCPVASCETSFATNRDLNRHLKGPHGNGIKEYVCPHEECQTQNRKFTRKDNLLRHLKEKHGNGKTENRKMVKGRARSQSI